MKIKNHSISYIGNLIFNQEPHSIHLQHETGNIKLTKHHLQTKY